MKGFRLALMVDYWYCGSWLRMWKGKYCPLPHSLHPAALFLQSSPWAACSGLPTLLSPCRPSQDSTEIIVFTSLTGKTLNHVGRKEWKTTISQGGWLEKLGHLRKVVPVLLTQLVAKLSWWFPMSDNGSLMILPCIIKMGLPYIKMHLMLTEHHVRLRLLLVLPTLVS